MYLLLGWAGEDGKIGNWNDKGGNRGNKGGNRNNKYGNGEWD